VRTDAPGIRAGMTAKELLQRGELSAAIATLTEEVKAHPTDTSRRIFLFELLCFTGDLTRAQRQLDAVGQVSAEMDIGVQVYRNGLAAEGLRQRFFSEGLRPTFLFTEPPYARLHLEAANRLRADQPREAEALLDEARSQHPSVAGTVNATPISDLHDGDDLLGPFLEVLFGTQYVWLPFEDVTRIEVNPPKKLRDLIWPTATIQCRTAPLGGAFIPALYAGSSAAADDRLKLGRMTDWVTFGEGLARGVGQRSFVTDAGEFPLLETRVVELTPPTAPGH
jgi:type VI secretion system protein ImpE